MTCTSQQAERECATIFIDAATLLWPAAQQRFDGVQVNSPPPSNASWFRWTFQHSEGMQASLANTDGQRRWRREGQIIVQCFGLLDHGGKTLAQRMAETIRDAYQGSSTQSGVWFRNATHREVGIDGPHYQANASIQFSYDEMR